ncbi:hypothetical protein ABBQ38_008558 [Trebouxia sp. C0009 RCD-2024]
MATSELAPAPAPALGQLTVALPTCELSMLTLLGQQEFYNASGYSITTELPDNLAPEAWQSLGCLKSVTNRQPARLARLMGRQWLLPSLAAHEPVQLSAHWLPSRQLGIPNCLPTAPSHELQRDTAVRHPARCMGSKRQFCNSCRAAFD